MPSTIADAVEDCAVDRVIPVAHLPRRGFTGPAQGCPTFRRATLGTVSMIRANPEGVAPGEEPARACEWNPCRVRARFLSVTQGRPLGAANLGWIVKRFSA
jgi:hypothetical protein